MNHCHYCHNNSPWLLFGRYCMRCWRKAPSVAALAASTRRFLGRPSLANANAEAAKGRPPAPGTTTRGPDGKARAHGHQPAP